MTPPTVIQKPRLAAFMFDQGVPVTIGIDDQFIALPSERWFFGSGAMDVLQVVRAEIPAYGPGQKNCGDYTEVAVGRYHSLHRSFAGAPAGTAIGIGRFKYIPDEQFKLPIEKRVGHGIVCAVTSPDRGLTLELQFFDFIPGCRVNLTPSEKQRCFLCDFS